MLRFVWPTLLPKNDFKKLLRNRHLRVRACVRAFERASNFAFLPVLQRLEALADFRGAWCK